MFRNFLLIILFFWNGCVTTFSSFLSSDSLSTTFDSDEENQSSSINTQSLKLQTNRYKEALHIFIFKVGQGNFCMIKKGGNAVIIDAGSHSVPNQDTVVFENIRNIFELCLNGAKIQAVIITHADEDHYNFLSSLEQYMDSSCFFVIGGTNKHANSILSNLSKTSFFYFYLDLASIDFKFKDKNFNLHEITKIEERLNSLIPNGFFQFLTPLQEIQTESKKNDYSLVFKFMLGWNSILFTGDATGNTYNAYFPKTSRNPEIKKRNITTLKEINLFMIPHHGADTDNSPLWSDVIINHNKTTLVGAIVSVGLDSPHNHPVSFIQNKPWPHTMLTEKSPVMAQWKQKGEDAKKTSKNMHARILETWNSFGFFDFVFTNSGDLLLLEKDSDKSFVWEVLIKENVPLASYDAVKAFYDESKKELNDIDRLALKFLPRYWRKQILEYFNCMSEDSDDCEGDIGEMENDIMFFDLDNEAAMNIINEDFNQSEENMIKIQEAITNEKYFIQNVTGDGNCGFYAILQALEPNSDFSSVQRGDSQWQQAKQLRQTMFPEDTCLSQMVTNEIPQTEREQHYLPLDTEEARQAIFRVANEKGRQVIIINSTYDSNPENTDPLNHLFMTLNADGNAVPYEDFTTALQNTGNNPIVLLYTPGHWQAILQKEK